MTQEIIKSMLSKLGTMLEFDEGIAVDSVEELKSKYDTFVKENFQQTETTILKEKKVCHLERSKKKC